MMLTFGKFGAGNMGIEEMRYDDWKYLVRYGILVGLGMLAVLKLIVDLFTNTGAFIADLGVVAGGVLLLNIACRALTEG